MQPETGDSPRFRPKATTATSTSVKKGALLVVASMESIHVRFPVSQDELAVVVCTLPHLSSLTDEDRRTRWLQKREYHMFYLTARAIAKETSEFGFGGSLLEDCLGDINEDRQHRMNQWCQQGLSRRGLERWSNRSHGDCREALKKHAIQKLLSLQEVMRLTGHRCVDKDELGRQYVELTQTAKNFALLLGHADHHAVVSSIEMEGRSPSMSRQQLLLRAFRQCPEPSISLQTAKNLALLLGHADRHHAVVSSIDVEGRSPSMSRQQLLLRAFRQCPVPRISLIVGGEVEANQHYMRTAPVGVRIIDHSELKPLSRAVDADCKAPSTKYHVLSDKPSREDGCERY